jgi:hypothetical protein
VQELDPDSVLREGEEGAGVGRLESEDVVGPSSRLGSREC